MNVLALNNTWLPSNNTVVTLRYGWTRFIDDDTLSIDFDPASLGFQPIFLNSIQVRQVPARLDHRLLQRSARIDPIAAQLVLVERQRHADAAAWPAHAEVRRGLPPHRDQDAVLRRRRRRFPVRSPLHLVEPADADGGHAVRQCLRQFPAGLHVGRSRQPEPHRRVEPVQRVRALLRRLRAGRLPLSSHDDAQLRPPARARERADGGERRLHRRLRSHAEPGRRARQCRQSAHRAAHRRRARCTRA